MEDEAMRLKALEKGNVRFSLSKHFYLPKPTQTLTVVITDRKKVQIQRNTHGERDNKRTDNDPFPTLTFPTAFVLVSLTPSIPS